MWYVRYTVDHLVVTKQVQRRFSPIVDIIAFIANRLPNPDVLTSNQFQLLYHHMCIHHHLLSRYIVANILSSISLVLYLMFSSMNKLNLQATTHWKTSKMHILYVLILIAIVFLILFSKNNNRILCQLIFHLNYV